MYSSSRLVVRSSIRSSSLHVVRFVPVTSCLSHICTSTSISISTSSSHLTPSTTSSSLSHRSFTTSSVNDSYQLWKKYNASGLAYLAKGDYDNAEKAFQRCSDANHVNTYMPALPPAFSAISRANLGSLYRDTGRVHQARECFSHALHHLEKSTDISWHTLASILREAAATSQALGEIETATRYINQALQLYKNNEIYTPSSTTESHTTSRSDPQSIAKEYAATLLEWGQMLHRQKKRDEAEGVYLRALEKLESIHGKPDFENTKSMSSDKDARIESSKAKTIDSSFAPVLTSLATVYYERQDYVLASEYYGKASEVYQQHNDLTFLETLEMVSLCLSRLFPKLDAKMDAAAALKHFKEGTSGEKATEATRLANEVDATRRAKEKEEMKKIMKEQIKKNMQQAAAAKKKE